MTTADQERQRIFEILNLPYPERCERMLEYCGRLFRVGWNAHAKYVAGNTEWDENPFEVKPRKPVLEEVPGNE